MHYTNRLRFVAVLLSACGTLYPLAVHAQTDEMQKNAPITVEAMPQSIPAGGSVTLSGRTVARDTTRPVTLTVTWLDSSGSARAERLSAAYRKDGSFSATYSPKHVGSYQVAAVSPDGSGADSARFTVLAAGAWADEQVKAEEQLLDASSGLIDAMAEFIARQPVSPPQQELEKRLPKLRAALAKRKETVANTRRVLEIHTEIVITAPGAALVYQPLNEQLAKIKEEADRLTPEAERAIARTRGGAAMCDQLMVMEDGIKLASAMLSVVASGAEAIFGFTTDIALGWATDKAPSWCTDNCKAAFTEVAKLHVGVEAKELAAKKLGALKEHYTTNLLGIVSDVVGFATQKLVGAYCERFEGPITARMDAEFMEHGKVWWKYTTHLQGKLVLNYRKGGNIDKGVAVSGVLVGTGYLFTVWEDALRVKFPDFVRRGTLFGTTLPPAGAPFVDVAGMTAIQPLPTAFLIPVEGELVGKKLTIRLKAATNDFNPEYTQARGTYMFVSPVMLPPVAFTSFTLPYEKADFIIQKATGADKHAITMDVVVTGKAMKAEKEFHGTSGTSSAKGTYQAKITVCNPKC